MKLYVAALAALTTLGAAEARCVPVSTDFEISRHDDGPTYEEWSWPQTAWGWDRDNRRWEQAWSQGPSDPTDPPDPTSTVPEPSTWAMMLIGFVGLGFAGYRARIRRGHGAARLMRDQRGPNRLASL
jgi:hypothetical protein